MIFSRRFFLQGGLSIGAMAALGAYHYPRRPSWSSKNLVLGAIRSPDAEGPHFVGLIDIELGGVEKIEVPFAAHGFAVDPKRPGRVIAYPHDPENRACEIDLLQKVVLSQITCPTSRHFYGHGTFSPDGRYLFSTENDYIKGRGLISIRDGPSLAPIGELPSFGVDPHEMVFISDGRTVAIANGGLKTDPRIEDGQKVLEPVESSLVLVDIQSQKPLVKWVPENPNLSFRHLAVLPNDELAISVQDKGFGRGVGSLLYKLNQNRELTGFQFSSPLRSAAHHHSLSVASWREDLIALTSPNGDLVTVWDKREQDFIRDFSISRASGVAVASEKLVISSHSGGLYVVEGDDEEPMVLKSAQLSNAHWGAHLATLTVL